jgi:hypothetical protein
VSNLRVTRDMSWLMISDYLGAVLVVETMRHLLQQFVDDLLLRKGCVGCRKHASAVTPVR